MKPLYKPSTGKKIAVIQEALSEHTEEDLEKIKHNIRESFFMP